MDDVQPMPGPPLSVARRSEQAIDQFVVRFGRFVVRRKLPPLRGRRAIRADRKYTRRISVRRSAVFDGVRPFASSLSRMNASMGVRASAWVGTAGRVNGRRDHQVSSLRARLNRPSLLARSKGGSLRSGSAVSGAPALGILGLDSGDALQQWGVIGKARFDRLARIRLLSTELARFRPNFPAAIRLVVAYVTPFRENRPDGLRVTDKLGSLTREYQQQARDNAKQHGSRITTL